MKVLSLSRIVHFPTLGIRVEDFEDGVLVDLRVAVGVEENQAALDAQLLQQGQHGGALPVAEQVGCIALAPRRREHHRQRVAVVRRERVLARVVRVGEDEMAGKVDQRRGLLELLIGHQPRQL